MLLLPQAVKNGFAALTGFRLRRLLIMPDLVLQPSKHSLWNGGFFGGVLNKNEISGEIDPFNKHTAFSQILSTSCSNSSYLRAPEIVLWQLITRVGTEVTPNRRASSMSLFTFDLTVSLE